MKDNINEFLLEIIPQIFEEHPELFLGGEFDENLSYFDQKIWWWNQNQLLLNEIVKKLPMSLKKRYSPSELFEMKKIVLTVSK